MKKHIPNALTCCNLLCGCVAVYFALHAEFGYAYIGIVCGALFDFFDGFAARLLGVSSPIGKELDSLADDITFGLAPAAILFSLLVMCRVSLEASFAAFLISAFSALRLAKFNLDERQALGFIGLPTPANALFFASLGMLLPGTAAMGHPELLFGCLMALVPLSCWLLVSEIPMFALKFKSYGWRGNELRLSFMVLSVVLLVLLGWGAFAAIVPLYIVTSLVMKK
ncbi:MAG: CDP-diacylglycerol--serine O-phosphatidyltransferase [Alloprevotella sp.]|nr:CDP-diacylglycerol--serine O-phosphatidyltransferase [Alloprevotella sp.]MBR1652241.1 CDP-diacylglycerol--serine O-phosphatidyltransferase [Alloprevotella sp.]MBR1732883.1 CDP-diacylglycerol--serine O-phosphatidyltransferase [Alloprevotella sp.]